MTDFITHVAVIFNGQIYSLPRPFRHHDVIRKIREDTGAGSIDGEEGFLVGGERFVNRHAAKQVALRNGQLFRGYLVGDLLTSEDLW